MGLVKRFDRNMDPKIDRELDEIVKQLPHKDDIKPAVNHINKPVTVDDLKTFAEGELTFNNFDNKIYFRSGDSLFNFTATKL